MITVLHKVIMSTNKTTKRQIWILPLTFLLGFMFAWGMILIDRQMLVQEQEGLREALEEAKIERKLREVIQDFGDEMEKIVTWNQKAIEPEEVPSGQVGK